MQAKSNRVNRPLQIAAAMFPLVAFTAAARADIFQWEYIDPADPSQGKQQSTTLAPDGAGVDAGPGADLVGRDLTMASLSGAIFFSAHSSCGDGFCDYLISVANLSATNLSRADLTGANLAGATLTDANFTGAEIRGARFDKAWGQLFRNSNFSLRGTGITLSQLYSTKSYQEHDLTGVRFYSNFLAGGNFMGQNLTDSFFHSANLTGADFTGAEIRGASFDDTGITFAQLHSTASYQHRDLTGVGLGGIDLHGEDFAGYNLTYAHFNGATLTGGVFHNANLSNASFMQAKLSDADFTGAQVLGVNFSAYPNLGTGVTLAQLYSTASYQAHDLRGIGLEYNNLAGANFAEKNLTAADFLAATLIGTDFHRANLTNASFESAKLTDANLAGAQVVGAKFGGDAITLAQLYSTASYQAKDLSGVGLYNNNLEGVDFSRQNLANADLGDATLTDADFRGANLIHASFYRAFLEGADFTGAEIRDASFQGDFIRHGITLAQLYLTASYQAKDLSGINFAYNNLDGANFAGQNLTNTVFSGPVPTGVNFTAADARGAYADLYTADGITTNLIRPDGHIDGVDLDANGLLVVRDYDGDLRYRSETPPIRIPVVVDPIPIKVDQYLAIVAGGALRMVFEADAWDSIISFAPGIPVTLGGTLELTFAADVNLSSQVGRAFHIFDWTGVSPTGEFAVASPYAWDLSKLYATGKVTLTGVPEPNSMFLLGIGLAAASAVHRNVSRNNRTGLRFATITLVTVASAAKADIYQWEYIDPADPNQGKQQSTTLAPDGAGADAAPGAILVGRNLTKAYLIGTDLSGADVGDGRGPILRRSSILTDADFNHANLTNTNFQGATLTDANITGAEIRGASFDIDLLSIPGRSDFPSSRTYIIGSGISPAQLYSTASYQAYDLIGIGFSLNNFSGANFANQNLADASFKGAELSGADFTGAEVRGADFGKPFAYIGNILDIRLLGTGLSVEQISSTANYHAHDLSGIDFSFNNFAGANFAGQNLAHTNFFGAQVGGADFTDAEVRGVSFDRFVYDQTGTPGHPLISGSGISPTQLFATASYQEHDIRGVSGIIPGIDLTTPSAANLILPNGHIQGVDLDAGGRLVVRDYDWNPMPIPITIDQHLSMGPGGTLRMLLEADAWDSTISFAPDIPVTLGGALELTFAADVNLASQVGRTFDLFNWDSVDPTSAFAVSSPYTRDLSNLYTTGEVTLTAIPEPGALCLLMFGLATFAVRGRATRRLPKYEMQIVVVTFSIVASATAARADIFQWEYINPADPSQGKQQSTTLAPDGADVDAVPGADLGYRRNLTKAYLIGADLTGAGGSLTNLTDADLSQANLTKTDFWLATLTDTNFAQANLTNAFFQNATMTDADFTSAEIRGADFSTDLHYGGTGITLVQIYSTASYQKHDLMGIKLADNDFTAANFAGQNLTNSIFSFATLTGANLSQANLTNVIFYATNMAGADLNQANLGNANFEFATLTGANLAGQYLSGANFSAATLTDANFVGSEIQGANFAKYLRWYEGSPAELFGTGITPAQLYSTASYLAGDLSGINFGYNNLASGNFAGQNLANADFHGATLTGADFNGAEVRSVNFQVDTYGTGITPAQLYSTASYLAGDLSGINLCYNNLAGGNFAGQKLTNANFRGTTLTDANFTDAEVRGVTFGNTIALAQLYSTASYQHRDLSGINIEGNDLAGGNFAGQNLSNTDFSNANLAGANFTYAQVHGGSFSDATGFTADQLYSTASYLAHDLTGIHLGGNDLSGWNLAGQNLANADLQLATLINTDLSQANLANVTFSGATLTNADLADAQIQGASFAKSLRRAPPDGASVSASLRFIENEIGTGITLEQLYSTASYRDHNLSRINLIRNNLAGGNFTGQNLSSAYFYAATLTGADLTAADARGSSDLMLSGATSANLIFPDGHISGLNLDAGGLLVVRDYDGDLRYEPALAPIPITVVRHLAMGPGGTLRMVFEADAWDSTISFAPGIPVTLGGTLELAFADDMDLASQVGRTFDLFDWTGVNPTGAFAVTSPYAWNLSNLYTTGEVTLTAVPEPRPLLLFGFALTALVAMGRRSFPF